mmetsp:Transcript_6821/g.12204  ORF Transcript_6821/g.12204 Transcript_6821/m.12204 type:complete len:544 (-) Transcript_6821:1150-2781(-)
MYRTENVDVRFHDEIATKVLNELGFDVSVRLRGCGCGCARKDSSCTFTSILSDPSSLPFLTSKDATTGHVLGTIAIPTESDYELVINTIQLAQQKWSLTPPPSRAAVLRTFADSIRKYIEQLGTLISLEMGKILAEGIGEVQEVLDICDLALGLCRSLSGCVLPSERPDHVILETWQSLGIVGVLSAFNFPMAVFGWNVALALVTGNAVFWKPSETTPLTALALNSLLTDALDQNGFSRCLSTVLVGTGDQLGQRMANDRRIDLLSFTGSTQVGRKVATRVASRLGKSLLELGGNNALVVSHDADLELALDAVLFGAVGTAGQRCTTTRRLILHNSIAEIFLEKLVQRYKDFVVIGDPLNNSVLCGPLHSESAVEAYTAAIQQAQADGGRILCGGSTVSFDSSLSLRNTFVEPTIVDARSLGIEHSLLQNECFSPILYVLCFEKFEDAIRLNNSVSQGLSSALFASDMKVIWEWLRSAHSGLVNVNVGTSGAEVGGAFGGEKDTGGGRESGSDSWKSYCRRVTASVNYGSSLPLSQGIRFSSS